ncbi:MAG: hypothetical protein HXS47_10965 [Theionarchaea archaeon]|nr:hypothetical protein [Theionarchaea archaeon]
MHRRKKMNTRKYVIVVVASLLVTLTFGGVPMPLQATATWTVMVYLDGDNNLESAAIDDFNEMEAIGSSSAVNIVVQFDRCGAYDNSNGDWQTTRRYYITKDPQGYNSTIVNTELSDLGEINMGDRSSLEDFITWGKTQYPAHHYLLVLWDHGSGWKKPSSEAIKSVCVDDTDADELTLAEIKLALNASTCSGDCPLDILGFDACFMGMLEIDYELLPYAHYRVGSQEYEPQDGWNYYALCNFLKSSPLATPATVAKAIVSTYMDFYGPRGVETQSAVHLNPTGTVVDTFDVLSLHLTGAMAHRSQIEQARENVEFFSDLDYIDLHHFAGLLKAYVGHKAIKKDAYLLMKAIDDAVIAEGHGFMNRNAHGISVYFPIGSAGYSTEYETKTKLAQDTFWDEFLQQYYSGSYSLSAVLEATPDSVKPGDLVTVSMTVTNDLSNTVMSVTPSSLIWTSSGSAFAIPVSGPVPATADLVGGQSATFVWIYQIFSGPVGGAIVFSGNAHGTDSVSSEPVFSPLVDSNPVHVPGPSQITEESTPDPNEQLQPVASNRIQSTENALEILRQQFQAKMKEGKDVEPCEALLKLVEEYLATAKENFQKGNYIAANYWTLQATAALEEAEECLEDL